MTTTLERPAERTRSQRMVGPFAVIGGLGAATLALALRDPHVQGSWGLCPSAAMGLSCPGCGGLRAVNDLTHGDVAAAASSNLAFIIAAPFIVLGLAVWALDRWTGRQRAVPPRLVTGGFIALGVGLLVFTVLRNLPAGSWLAP